MYYLYQVEIYTLKFYNQYNLKKLIMVVCFSLPSKYTAPLKQWQREIEYIQKIVDCLIIIKEIKKDLTCMDEICWIIIN